MTDSKPIDTTTARPELWMLDPAITFLNHGSFGACPRAVLALQQQIRDELERQPVRFFLHEYGPRLDAARADLGSFLGADGDDLAFVPNATTGVNTVLQSLRFNIGDEIVVTDHEYNACRNAVDAVARTAGVNVIVVPVPFPLPDPGLVVEAVLARLTRRTRLVLIDHVTSPTGLVMPLEEIIAELNSRGVDVLVDGAHVAGMLDLNITELAPTYYTGNCHKWLCAPKGAAFLYVRRDRQPNVRPLVVSHGANADAHERSRFRLEFDWVGTHDPTPFLCVPEAIRHLEAAVEGGWPALRARNRALALEARDLLCSGLGIDPPCPDTMIGSLAAVPLPDGSEQLVKTPLFSDPLRLRLLEAHSIEVPIVPWPQPPRRLLRISAQLYNRREHYQRLVKALVAELGLATN